MLGASTCSYDGSVVRQKTPHDVAVGRAIRVIRTEHGMSRKDLAERSGLSYPYVSEIETGKKSPSSKALRAIADAIGLPPHELLAAAETLAMGPRTWTSPSRRSYFHESTDAKRSRAEPTEDFAIARLGRFGPSIAANMPPPDEQRLISDEIATPLEDHEAPDIAEVNELVERFRQLSDTDKRLVLHFIRRLSED